MKHLLLFGVLLGVVTLVLLRAIGFHAIGTPKFIKAEAKSSLANLRNKGLL